MNRLSTAELVKILKNRYKNNDSVVSTFHASRADYGPSERTIGKPWKKFEVTGSVTDVIRPIHHLTSSSEEIIAVEALKNIEMYPFIDAHNIWAFLTTC